MIKIQSIFSRSINVCKKRVRRLEIIEVEECPEVDILVNSGWIKRVTDT